MEPTWLKEALFGGQTANGFKLGTTLSRGWFWVRARGCRLVYRSGSMETIYFDNILTVTESQASEITIPGYLSHEPGQTYFYVVRCANQCGRIERTLLAAVKVSIDDEGGLQDARPNGVFGLDGKQKQDGKIEIIWGYNPIEQASNPKEMRVYSDAGTGEIDFQEPVAIVPYKGRRFYRYEDESQEGRYLFAVRAVDAKNNEHSSTRKVSVEVHNEDVEAIEIVGADS
jgi:hypothetical protein